MPVSEKTLDKINNMLEWARQIVSELESGETVETESDAAHAIAEVRKLAAHMLSEAK
jgi:hypothetical protein